MDDLPIEIFLKIIKLLPTNQLFLSKLVNRKWYSIISGETKFKFERLAVSDTWHFNRRWYSNYKIVDCNDLIKCKNYNLFQFDPIHFFRLKHLYLHSNNKKPYANFNLSNLVNQLEHLEILEISRLRSNSGEDECINLKNLKLLNINKFQFNLLTLNTPKLSSLKLAFRFSLRNEMKFVYPKEMRSLEVEKLNSEYIEMFSNLEYLYVTHIHHLGNQFLLGL